MKDTNNSKKHLRRIFSVEAAKLFEINLFLVSENNLDKVLDFFGVPLPIFFVVIFAHATEIKSFSFPSTFTAK